jgi:hypothetical protein
MALIRQEIRVKPFFACPAFPGDPWGEPWGIMALDLPLPFLPRPLKGNKKSAGGEMLSNGDVFLSEVGCRQLRPAELCVSLPGSGYRVVYRSASSVGQNLSKLPYQWENSFSLGMA